MRSRFDYCQSAIAPTFLLPKEYAIAFFPLIEISDRISGVCNRVALTSQFAVCFADATRSRILYALALGADGTPAQYDL